MIGWTSAKHHDDSSNLQSSVDNSLTSTLHDALKIYVPTVRGSAPVQYQSNNSIHEVECTEMGLEQEAVDTDASIAPPTEGIIASLSAGRQRKKSRCAYDTGISRTLDE